MKTLLSKFFGKVATMLLWILIAQGVMNATNCAVLSAGLSLDCDYPLVGGVKDDIKLINLSDIASVTRNGTNSQIIEAITLATGKSAYEYQGKNNSCEPQASLTKQRYAEMYTHEVMFKVFVNTPTAKQQLEKMAQARVVAVIENNHQTGSGNTSFEIYGLGTGLELAEMTRVPADNETQGAYNIVLRSSEHALEAHLPNPLFITDYATTKAVYDAL